jgi:hypothetical protein
MQRGGARDAASTALTVTLFALVMAAVVLSAVLIRPPGASASAAVSDPKPIDCPPGFHAPVCYQSDLMNAGRSSGNFRCLLVSATGSVASFPDGTPEYVTKRALEPGDTITLLIKVSAVDGGSTIEPPGIICDPI